MNEKRCSKCGEVKQVSDFLKDSRHADGLQSQCRSCRNQYKRIYYSKHAEEDKARSKRWHQSNRDRLKEYFRKGREKLRSHHNARAAVNQAIKYGKLPKVATLKCVECGDQAKQYHHHLGYEKEHYLDVVPLCMACHKD